MIRFVNLVPVGDCSHVTPPWLDKIARRIGPSERKWMERRISQMYAIDHEFLNDAQRAELERLREELHTGHRGGAR